MTNYSLLVGFESKITELQKKQNTDTPAFTDGSKASETGKTGTPVYYVSNLHAGKEFYLDSLKGNYQLTFSDDFASVMDEIETEYKEKNKLSDASDSRTDGLTTSADSLLVRNWQDILAVYVYEPVSYTHLDVYKRQRYRRYSCYRRRGSSKIYVRSCQSIWKKTV